jgi:hypothetical protein
MFRGGGGGLFLLILLQVRIFRCTPTFLCTWRVNNKNFFFLQLVCYLVPWCDHKLLLSKLYLHGIYYNVIRQDPNHDTLF